MTNPTFVIVPKVYFALCVLLLPTTEQIIVGISPKDFSKLIVYVTDWLNLIVSETKVPDWDEGKLDTISL